MCDQPPPAPVPPIPDTRPELEATFRRVLGLYRDEIIKDQAERSCRIAVRAENAEAFRRAGK